MSVFLVISWSGDCTLTQQINPVEAQNTAALQEAQRQIAEHNAALAAAQAQVDAAQTAATDAAAAAQAAIAANGQGQAANGPAPAPQLIPKPHLAPGETMNIQGAMGINKSLYGEIRVSTSLRMHNSPYLTLNSVQYRVHGLVHAANLEWQQDFRNQDAEKLACMFKAVSSASVSELFTH